MKLEHILLKTVSEQFNVTEEDIKSMSRKREIVIARQASFYLARNYFFKELSLVSIPVILIGVKMDHATVAHSVRTIEDLMQFDNKLATKVNNCRYFIQNSDEITIPISKIIQQIEIAMNNIPYNNCANF